MSIASAALCRRFLEKQNASKIVQRYAIARVLGEDLLQMLRRAVVIAFLTQNSGIEEVGPGQIGTERQRFFKNGAGAGDVAFSCSACW